MSFIVFKHDGQAQHARSLPDQPVISREQATLVLEADALLAQAREEAARIVATAQQAYEDERVRGYEDGLAEARLEQSERMIDLVSRSVDYFGRIEGRMVDLVLQAVRSLLDEFDERERVVQVVRKALSAARNQKQLVLRIHPEKAEIVRAAMHEILEAYPGVGYLDVVPDSRVATDGCILESDIGVIEASMSGQLEALRKAFNNVLGSRV